MRKKVSTTLDAQPSSTIGPTWHPTRPGEEPKLPGDKLAHDRQRALEVVHQSPTVVMSLDELQAELLVAKDHYVVAIRHPDQDSPSTPGQYVLRQLNGVLELDKLPAMRAHDGLLPLRALAYALEDYAVGRPGRLNALFGRTPRSVTTGARSTAAVNAAKIFCVGRLREGGVFGERTAERLVADRAARAGLPGTPESVHQACLSVKPGGPRRSQQVVDFLALMEAEHPLPADWPQKGQDDRQRWLNQIDRKSVV
jgi:hypothetical protein